MCPQHPQTNCPRPTAPHSHPPPKKKHKPACLLTPPVLASPNSYRPEPADPRCRPAGPCRDTNQARVSPASPPSRPFPRVAGILPARTVGVPPAPEPSSSLPPAVGCAMHTAFPCAAHTVSPVRSDAPAVVLASTQVFDKDIPFPGPSSAMANGKEGLTLAIRTNAERTARQGHNTRRSDWRDRSSPPAGAPEQKPPHDHAKPSNQNTTSSPTHPSREPKYVVIRIAAHPGVLRIVNTRGDGRLWS